MRSNVQNLAARSVVALPSPPERFSYDEWYRQIAQKFRAADDQTLLADRILEESTRVIENINEKLSSNKELTELRMKEKVFDIEFVKSEIERSRTVIQVELEALGVFRDRIQDALNSVRSTGKTRTQKCCIMREGRLGIDLVQDNVEVELRKEIKTIDGAEMILQRTLEQVKEIMRELRATLYLLNRDLEDKMKVLSIEKDCLNMRTTDLNLSTYHGTTPLDASNIAFHEWQHYTDEVILKGFQNVNSARNFRNVVDRVLKEVVDDLRNQYNAVNEAFSQRIEELKEMKVKFEKQLFEVNRQINEMTRNITELEKAIADKEGYMALAHTRLGKRAHRPQVELVRDEVETRLVSEVIEIRAMVEHLQKMLEESQANLRYLCKIQIQLQEDINIKVNSIKIDEVDCMTLRQARLLWPMFSNRWVMKSENDKQWPRYTPHEWHNYNRQKYCTTVERGLIAEKLIEHSERIRAQIQEFTLKKKEETELFFRGRIEDVDFLRVELESVRRIIQIELEALDILQERIQDEIKCVRSNSEEIVNKCIQFRKKRTGIDLICDEVDRELKIEKKKILEAGVRLNEILEQTKEFKRDLRASIYLLNQDVKNKLDCLNVEFECLNLKESDNTLRINEEDENYDKTNTVVYEWKYFSQENMRKANEKIQAARQFQARVKIILGEIMADLIDQNIRVNESFNRRIDEIKEAKAKLEEQHQEMTRQVNGLKQNIFDMIESIKKKQEYLALAKARLVKRCNRPKAELVRDRVEISLIDEISEGKNSIAKLSQLRSEAEKTLRYLLEGQLQLEEEINVKINSIKIDEVDCLTIRQNINYQLF